MRPVEVSSVRVSLHMGFRPQEEEKVISHSRGSIQCPSRGVRRTLEGPGYCEPPVAVYSVRVPLHMAFRPPEEEKVINAPGGMP